MGNKAPQKEKDKIPFDIRDEKNKFKLPNVLHLTAAKLISKAKFTDLEKLHDKKYCDNLVILTSKILRHHLNSQEVLWLDRSIRDQQGNPIENMKKEPLVHLDKNDIPKLDVVGEQKKQHMCTGIAKFYIKVAHLFAAINKTVNPQIAWKDINGKHLTPVMNKSEVPKGVQTSLAKLNFCTQRIAAIKPIHNTDKNILIKAKNCNMNIQSGGANEPSFFDSINNAIDNAINTTKESINGALTKTKETIQDVQEKATDGTKKILQHAESIKQKPDDPNVPHLISAQEQDSTPPENTQENQQINPPEKVEENENLAKDEPPIQDDGDNKEQSDITQEAKEEMKKIQEEEKKEAIAENTPEKFNNKDKITKALTDEIGIPELEALYFDVYNFKTGVYDQKSDESQKQYKQDLEKFYKTFSLQDKMPDNIQKFSDIKLKDFHNQPLCNDKESPWKKSYHATPNHKDFDLFQKYAKHIADMTMKNKQNEQKLVAILDEMFAYWIDEKTKVKELTIHPELTMEKLDKLVPETRELIINLYVDCEKDFQEGLNMLEAIIKKRMLINAENRVERFKEKHEKLLSNDMTQETNATPSPDAVGATDVPIETQEEIKLNQPEEQPDIPPQLPEKKEESAPVVGPSDITVNDQPIVEEPNPAESDKKVI